MTIPLSPSISLSPSTFNTAREVITATVSTRNRPAYHGKPKITGLTTITPKIICSRTPSGVLPFHVQVSACETTHDGASADNAYMDLHYEWDFGDASGTETFTDYWNWKTVNANNEQQGPEAAYLYRAAGTYTITLTAKGKDANGTIVSASTTTVLTVGQYYVHLGGATGGTYTLTVNGETTAAIAYNAIPRQVVSALHALASLDATNCRTGLLGMIELNGNLSGTTVTFTIDSTSLTGTVSTPAIRTEQTSASSATVSVSDLSGLTAQYFDSNYDGSNGAPNGTESRPYTTFAALESFVEGGGSRVAWMKRGSSWNMNSRIGFNTNGMTTTRMLPYGTGAAPALTQSTTSANFWWELSYGSASVPNIFMGDFVLSGVDITTTAEVKSVFITAGSNGTAGYPYSRIQNIVFDQCTWSTTLTAPEDTGFFQSSKFNTPIYGTAQGGTTSSVTLKSGASSTNDIYNGRAIVVVIDGTPEYSTVTDYDGTTKIATVSPSFVGTPDSDDTYVIHFPSAGCQMQGAHLWRCELNAAASQQVGIIQSNMGAWSSSVGDTLSGGVGDLTRDHHIYMYTTGHNLLRYVRFGSGTKNFCINGNAAVHGGAMQYSTFDGCDFTGTKNAIDMSNTDNIWTGHPDDGYCDDVVLQFCRLHSGGVSATEQNAIVSYNLKEATARYCDFWDNLQAHVSLANTAGYPWQPKLYIYHSRFHGGRIEVRGTQAHYFHNNVCHSVLDSSSSTAYCLQFYNTAVSVLSDWDADGNIWYNQQTSNPFRDSVGAAEVTFATWQAAGNDSSGSVSNPNWSDPANGVFADGQTVAVDWGAEFDDTEYSTDGVSWSAYTDGNTVAIADTNDRTVLYFRAHAPVTNGPFTVTVTSDATSGDIGSETDDATLQGNLTILYFAISTGSGVLMLSVAD